MASRHTPHAQQMPSRRRILLKPRLCLVALHGCTASERCLPGPHFALCLRVLKASCLNPWIVPGPCSGWDSWGLCCTLGGVCPITFGLLKGLIFEGCVCLLKDSRAPRPIPLTHPLWPAVISHSKTSANEAACWGGESRGAQRPGAPAFLPLLWVRARKKGFFYSFPRKKGALPN